jgi:16S rRNA processing protein RimM
LNSSRVVVAGIIKPRGIRGELLARSQTDVPGRLENLQQAQALLSSGIDVPVEIVEAWPHKEDWVFKFAGIDSIEQADPFRGAQIWVPVSERAQLPAGDFFEVDLVGLTVIDTVGVRTLGVVEAVEHYGGPPLLMVNYQGRELLIPFVPAICEVDLPAKVIRATLPDGLLEL